MVIRWVYIDYTKDCSSIKEHWFPLWKISFHMAFKLQLYIHQPSIRCNPLWPTQIVKLIVFKTFLCCDWSFIKNRWSQKGLLLTLCSVTVKVAVYVVNRDAFLKHWLSPAHSLALEKSEVFVACGRQAVRYWNTDSFDEFEPSGFPLPSLLWPCCTP